MIEAPLLMRETIIQAMHRSACLTREQIWRPLPPYIPKVRTEFSLLPRPGFIGNKWRPGSIVLVGSNGNSTENRSPEKFQEYDIQHSALLQEFRETPREESFAELMEFEVQDISRWSLRSTIDRVLERLNEKIQTIAVLNVIPFSTKESPPNSSPTWQNSVKLHLEPVLAALKPSRVVWLGIAAANRGGVHLHFPRCVFHTVSRQRDLTWEKRLSELPYLQRN